MVLRPILECAFETRRGVYEIDCVCARAGGRKATRLEPFSSQRRNMGSGRRCDRCGPPSLPVLRLPAVAVLGETGGPRLGAQRSGRPFPCLPRPNSPRPSPETPSRSSRIVAAPGQIRTGCSPWWPSIEAGHSSRAIKRHFLRRFLRRYFFHRFFFRKNETHATVFRCRFNDPDGLGARAAHF
jgi:hypothetical protein